MSKRVKHPRDTNQLAKSVVDLATGEIDAEESEDDMAKLGRAGGLKGGRARAAKLTDEQRREIAKKAAKARWEK